MSFPANVERWRQLATWEAKDLPVNYVLAVIQYESGGTPGNKGRKKRQNAYPMQNRAGETVQIDRDLGLMQVSPILAKTFNDDPKTEPAVTYEDFIGATERDCRIQIRVGCYGLAFNVRALFKHFPETFQARSARNANENQLRFALMGNALGPHGLRKRLNALRERGLPLTWGNFRQVYGKALGPWVRGVDKRWTAYAGAGVQSSGEEGAMVPYSPTVPNAPGPSTAMSLQQQPDYSTMKPMQPVKEGVKDKIKGFLGDYWWIILALLGAYLLQKDENGERRLNGLLNGNGGSPIAGLLNGITGEPVQDNPDNVSLEPIK